MRKSEFKKMFELEDNHFWFVGKRYFIKTIIDNFLPEINLKILDIGCGTGGTTVLLKKYGKVIGLEKNKYAQKLAKKRGLEIIAGDAHELPFSNQNFDLVTIFDVLYHKEIKDIKKTILEVNRVLKKDGFVLITDSAFNFLKSTHDKALSGNKRFTIDYLNKILENCGFATIKSSYLFFSIFPLVFLKRKIFGFFAKKEASDVRYLPKSLNYLFTKTLSFEARLLKFINYPIGSSLIILAKKRS